MERKQQVRRTPLEQESNALAVRQRQAGHELATRQKEVRAALRQGYLQESHRIRLDRAAHKPKGLAAFLGRITGVELVTKKIYRYRDKTRHDALLAQKRELADRQKNEVEVLTRRQELETLTVQRRIQVLELVEKRELRSLEMALVKERRVKERDRTSREPSPEPRMDVFNKAAKKPIDLMAEFERAAGSGEAEGESSGGSARDPAPEAEITIQRRRRTKDRSPEVERPARTKGYDRDTDNNGPSDDDPAPRRRRDRDFDRGR